MSCIKKKFNFKIFSKYVYQNSTYENSWLWYHCWNSGFGACICVSKFYFLNTTMEKKIKILLIWIMHAWKYKTTWIYFICWNWYMLKFRLWSNHIPISQSLSSKLDLEETRLSISCTSVRPLEYPLRIVRNNLL